MNVGNGLFLKFFNPNANGLYVFQASDKEVPLNVSKGKVRYITRMEMKPEFE